MANPRVVVVGAGAAGIAAASKLYQSGITNVTILEASDRYGGRLHTTPFGSAGVVELGAQWCHGEQGNVVHELASGFPGLLKSSVAAEKIVLVRSNGQRVDPDVFERLMAMSEALVESEERDEFEGSLGEFFTAKYWEKIDKEESFRDVERALAEQFLVYYYNYNRGYNAYDSWYEVAAQETDSYEPAEGNQALAWTGPKGFSTVLDILSGNYPSSSLAPVPLEQLTKFNELVTNIDWRETPAHTVIVTTKIGSCYDVDHVILTVPLGVLKEAYRTLFTPPIPSINQNAIEGIYFGTLNKVFLSFDTPIPEQLGNVLHMLWYENDLKTLRESKHSWAEAVSTFSRVDGQPNALCAWLNGPEGRQAEQLPDDTVQEGLLYLLSIFANNVHFGKVQAILRSNWSSNRLFRGSYSSRSITTERMQTGAKYLTYPLMDAMNTPRVLMAGEATSHVHYGTVQGAIESGQREAQRLIDLYK
ncbi:spermine oxidase-like [Anopheles cruzii]|uniref:spermine oxidase-like n=1 Tax=Anopheles cruzii TaxID=68878 RepID=UPI0022EC500B|nr:spermine oxidase-like [Anopheles cruzii]